MKCVSKSRTGLWMLEGPAVIPGLLARLGL
jgi:hypothetical protein